MTFCVLNTTEADYLKALHAHADANAVVQAHVRAMTKATAGETQHVEDTRVILEAATAEYFAVRRH